MSQISLVSPGPASGLVVQGTSEYITRLMNSALQERHIDQRWLYDGQMVGDGILVEVAFAPETGRRMAWPRDYCFRPVHPHSDTAKPSVSVHTDLISLAVQHGADINQLHSFMRFPPVRAVVRTLLIELESPEAQQGQRPDDTEIVHQVYKIILSTSPFERQTYLTRTTATDSDFADRALVLCLVKLYTHLESWNRWRFGSGELLVAVEVLVSVVGLFCNAWVHAPAVDVSWCRLRESLSPPCPFIDRTDNIGLSPVSSLTPEIWFEWSLMFDPWIRRVDSTQLLINEEESNLEASVAPFLSTTPVYIAEVSQPEADKEGRVFVKYLSKPDEERWAFKALLDSKWTGKKPRTRLEYLVDWEFAEPSWQPARDLQGCDEWVLQYHRSHPEKPGPVSKLRPFL